MTKDELKPIDTSKYKITETGQVLKTTKDEMKNRISMTLKDPVLQRGFEIICKNLAELEKENAELKEQIEKMKCDILSLVKDRMNDDVDQNVIERLAEKWGIKEK